MSNYLLNYRQGKKFLLSYKTFGQYISNQEFGKMYNQFVELSKDRRESHFGNYGGGSSSTSSYDLKSLKFKNRYKVFT